MHAECLLASHYDSPPAACLLVYSTGLGFTATNEVLSTNGYRMIEEADYKIGCRYTTPERFNFHVEQPLSSEVGQQLGEIFDQTYVKRVSEETAGLFDGMEQLLRSLALSGHPQVSGLLWHVLETPRTGTARAACLLRNVSCHGGTQPRCALRVCFPTRAASMSAQWLPRTPSMKFQEFASHYLGLPSEPMKYLR